MAITVACTAGNERHSVYGVRSLLFLLAHVDAGTLRTHCFSCLFLFFRPAETINVQADVDLSDKLQADGGRRGACCEDSWR